MKGFVKVIIAGAVILGIGIAILIIALAVNGWKFDFKETEYEMKSYTAEGQFDTLSVDISAGEVDIVYYDGETIKFDYPENNRLTATVVESKSEISFVSKKKHFWDWVSWGTNIPKTTISVPQDCKLNLNIDLNAGIINLPDGEFEKLDLHLNAGEVTGSEITASSLECKMNAGNIKFESVECTSGTFKLNAGTLEISRLACDKITTNLNAGTATLHVVGTATEYTVDIDKNAGSCNIANHTGTDDKKSITGKMNAGALNITFIH